LFRKSECYGYLILNGGLFGMKFLGKSMSEVKEYAVSKFKLANAVSIETAKLPDEILEDHINDKIFVMGLQYLKTNGFVKSVQKKLYLDEETLVHPQKHIWKRSFAISALLILAACVLIAILAILK
jgi:hypothetical protein